MTFTLLLMWQLSAKPFSKKDKITFTFGGWRDKAVGALSNQDCAALNSALHSTWLVWMKKDYLVPPLQQLCWLTCSKRCIYSPVFSLLQYGQVIPCASQQLLQGRGNSAWKQLGMPGSDNVTYRFPWPIHCWHSLLSPAAVAGWQWGAIRICIFLTKVSQNMC